jgi:phosphatidylglycerophosphatase A
VSDWLTLGSAFYIGFGYSMRRLLASCFGLGWLPLAPGTWGSLPPVAIFALLAYFDVSAITIFAVMAVLILVGSILCVMFTPQIISDTGNKDPREVVVDEFAGQAVTFSAIPFILMNNTFSSSRIWITVLLGFILFRSFDILKPWPIRKLEKLPRGWGVLVDDLLAGLYAAITLMICLRLWAVFSSG